MLGNELRKFLRRNNETICADLAYQDKEVLKQIFPGVSARIKEEVMQAYTKRGGFVKDLIDEKVYYLGPVEKTHKHKKAPGEGRWKHKAKYTMRQLLAKKLKKAKKAA